MQKQDHQDRQNPRKRQGVVAQHPRDPRGERGQGVKMMKDLDLGIWKRKRELGIDLHRGANWSIGVNLVIRLRCALRFETARSFGLADNVGLTMKSSHSTNTCPRQERSLKSGSLSLNRLRGQYIRFGRMQRSRLLDHGKLSCIYLMGELLCRRLYRYSWWEGI
jgi:hypothetical protein